MEIDRRLETREIQPERSPEEAILFVATTPGIDTQSRLSLIRFELNSIRREAREEGDIPPAIITEEPPRVEEMGILQGKEVKKTRLRTERLIMREGVSVFKEKHLGFGDSQFPDVDRKAIDSILRLNDDFKADHIWLMGDMMNATTLGKYGYPADYHFSFWDEVRGTRELLKDIVGRVREANPKVKVHYLEGNHEFRLQKYIDKNADQLSELEDSAGERVLGLPNLLNLKDLGVEWTPYWEDDHVTKDVTILHGNIARVKGGYTAQAYIDRYGQSTIAGHDHRLALVFRTQSGDVKFGIETGSTCKRNMAVPYGRANQIDWQQGLFILGIDNDGDAHPAVIPVVNGKTSFAGKVYQGRT